MTTNRKQPAAPRRPGIKPPPPLAPPHPRPLFSRESLDEVARLLPGRAPEPVVDGSKTVRVMTEFVELFLRARERENILSICLEETLELVSLGDYGSRPKNRLVKGWEDYQRALRR
jgi:hypothetical protein